jgi:hypothetical protein
VWKPCHNCPTLSNIPRYSTTGFRHIDIVCVLGPISLPKLNIRQEPSPFWLLVVGVKLFYFLNRECSPATQKVRRAKIPPWCPENELVGDCNDHDEQYSELILEEIIRRERSAAQWENACTKTAGEK